MTRHRFYVSEEQLEAARAHIKEKPSSAPQEFVELADHVMKKEGWEQATTASEAKLLYQQLLKVLEPLASAHSKV